MALKSLSTEEMVQISSAWVSPQDPARGRLQARPRLTSLLPDLEQAHRAIVAVIPEATNPRLAQIAELSAAEDAVHDRVVRGLFGYLSDAALLDERGPELLALRDLLFPDGISAVIHATYRGQAGYAARLRERLTPETKALLAQLTIRTGASHTLGDHVETWLAAAEKIGKLQDEAARVAVAASPSQAAQIVTARNNWIRVVNAFLSIAELDALDEESERLIFGPLRDAEATAERRSAKRKPSDEPPSPVLADS
jgi:hypothetical protein